MKRFKAFIANENWTTTVDLSQITEVRAGDGCVADIPPHLSPTGDWMKRGRTYIKVDGVWIEKQELNLQETFTSAIAAAGFGGVVNKAVLKCVESAAYEVCKRLLELAAENARIGFQSFDTTVLKDCSIEIDKKSILNTIDQVV